MNSRERGPGWGGVRVGRVSSPSTFLRRRRPNWLVCSTLTLPSLPQRSFVPQSARALPPSLPDTRSPLFDGFLSKSEYKPNPFLHPPHFDPLNPKNGILGRNSQVSGVALTYSWLLFSVCLFVLLVHVERQTPQQIHRSLQPNPSAPCVGI